MINNFFLFFSRSQLHNSWISSEIESSYFFSLMEKSNKKNLSAAADEIWIISLKSRNSRVEFDSLKDVPAQTALIF